MKAYKVVSIKDGRYFSSVAGYSFTLEYFIDQWVTPKIEGSRLFAFKEFQEAKDYHNGMGHSSIFECEIDGCIEYYPALFFDSIPQYWALVNQNLRNKKNLKKTNIDRIIDIKKGIPSILTRGIKLIKEV